MDSLFNSFLDPSISKFKYEKLSHEFLIYTPNGAEILIDLESIVWDKLFDNQQHTTLMWYHSLGFLLSIIDDNSIGIDERCSIVNKFLLNYLDFRKSAKNNKFNESMFSLDHCIAIRLRIFGILIEKINNNFLSLEKKTIIELVDLDINIAGVDNFIKNDNHGMMLCVSLVLIFDFFNRRSERISHIKKLVSILQNVFDVDGFAKENTIGYHDFYCKFLGKFVDNYILFRTALGLETMDKYDNQLIDIRRKADLARSKVVWNCGGIPPIGDSGQYNTKLPSQEGVHFFSESGLVVFKQKDLYFSLICGSGSEVHKQMDDTSITLRYKNVDILIDSGLFTFDWENNNRRYVASQRGYSGIFIKEFDEYLRPIMLRKHKTFKAEIIFCHYEFDCLSVMCRVSIDDNFLINRLIFLDVNSSKLKIFDEVISIKSSVFIQRFVFPGEVSIDDFFNGEQFSILCANNIFVNSIFRVNNDVNIFIGEGVRSVTYNEVLPSKFIEISSLSSRVLKFSAEFYWA